LRNAASVFRDPLPLGDERDEQRSLEGGLAVSLVLVGINSAIHGTRV
jgi:hypothetical protein